MNYVYRIQLLHMDNYNKCHAYNATAVVLYKYKTNLIYVCVLDYKLPHSNSPHRNKG